MKIDATIITGFLGSGKTTLINRLLGFADFSRAAILVNEFGSVSIDHDILAYASERLAVLSGGCICCSIREDIEEAVRYLFEARATGKISDFDHLFVETSGLADPVPLIHTFQSSPVLSSRFRLKQIVGTVDAQTALATLARFPEALKQISLADVLFVTKTDQLNNQTQGIDLEQELSDLNPWANIVCPNPGMSLEDASILDALKIYGSHAQSEGTLTPISEFWQRRGPASTRRDGEPAHDLVRSSISSFALCSSEILDWTAFGIWLTLLLHRHGASILRVKGFVKIAETGGPVIFHSVQHVVYPPIHVAEWPSTDHTTRLIFIVKDLDISLLQRSLTAFNGIAASQAAHFSDSMFHKPLGAGTSVNGRPVRRPGAPAWIK